MPKRSKSKGVGPRLLSGASFGPPPGKGSPDEAILEDYLDEVSRHDVLPHEIQSDLALMAQEGDKNAEHRLVSTNLRLVLAMAVRYRGRGLPLADLVQEGNHGLMQAVSRYNPGKKTRFSTYALWWIRQALERSVANQARIIRLPIHFRDRVHRIRKAREAFLQTYSREPTLEDLSLEVGLPLKKVKEALRRQHDALSMDGRPTGGASKSEESEGGTLGDRIRSSEATWDPGRFLYAEEKRRDLAWALGTLEPRERKVLEVRYGLDDGKSRTLEQVGKSMNITRERVRQIEAKALKKLRTSEVEARIGIHSRRQNG